MLSVRACHLVLWSNCLWLREFQFLNLTTKGFPSSCVVNYLKLPVAFVKNDFSVIDVRKSKYFQLPCSPNHGPKNVNCSCTVTTDISNTSHIRWLLCLVCVSFICSVVLQSAWNLLRCEHQVCQQSRCCCCHFSQQCTHHYSHFLLNNCFESAWNLLRCEHQVCQQSRCCCPISVNSLPITTHTFCSFRWPVREKSADQ